MPVNDTDYTLSSLFSSYRYTLAYALPLLLLSIVLTFAGAFFTVDRSHTFAPQNDVVRSPSSTNSMLKKLGIRLRNIFLLEGGIGGLASGYVFGGMHLSVTVTVDESSIGAVHLSTFLALIVPSKTNQAPLSAASFLPVWIISALVCTLLAGRWKYAALAAAGIAGYILEFNASTLTSILTLVGAVMCLMPLQKYQHAFLRVATSPVGAFGMTLSIVLFACISLERLWISYGDGWNMSQEKGLSAAYCIFLLMGAACDWFLHNKLGENPDQKWDTYLTECAATLPNEAGHAGTFTPLTSFWSHHFGYKDLDPIAKDIVFTTDAELRFSIPLPHLLQKRSSSFTPSSPTEGFESPK
ncbi:hypothetical protein SCP_0704660 [Sparassis crispa]|uniref:DUF4203 domain-containing protein n=1 Tax=Sparassis crispa TaxID=139825 RepID=A0A401GSY7_9APHY|nr:hypothetical protein SCP_0704660 [Sparassis crispa]GBE85279.1 hypothetical protein SCP_0704660 [Sparassis crispa]